MISEYRFKILDCGILYVVLFNLLESEIALAPVLPSPDISRIGVARPRRWVCHRVTAGGRTRGVLEQYVAGFDTRGHPEGRSYLRSQQAIREIFGLEVYVQN